MESSFDYTSMEDDSKPSERQLLHKMENISDYEPGSTEYSEASLEVAKQLADHVSEDNSDATYEEVMDIEPGAFEALDEVEGQKGVVTKDQMDNIAAGETMFNDIALRSVEGLNDSYAAQVGGYNAARMAELDSKNEADFSIESEEERQNFMESFYKAVERRTGSEQMADEALDSLGETLNRGVFL